MALNEDAGPPDEFLLDSRARYRRQMSVRLRCAVILVILGVSVTVAGLVLLHWSLWALVTIPAVALVAAAPLMADEDPGARPRPSTALEVGCVVGVETTSWGNASDDQHTVRILLTPLGGGAADLIHGYLDHPASSPCPVSPGMLIGFRRHPTVRHLVWLESGLSPRALLGLRTGRDVRPGSSISATVRDLTIGEESSGTWWRTTITVRTDDGTELSDVAYRLPEELARYQPGRQVQVVRHHGPGHPEASCSILPPSGDDHAGPQDESPMQEAAVDDNGPPIARSEREVPRQLS